MPGISSTTWTQTKKSSQRRHKARKQALSVRIQKKTRGRPPSSKMLLGFVLVNAALV